MDEIMNPYLVYVKTDDAGRITAVNSSAFLPDASGWTQIDEGYGDRFHHAQGNYLPGPLMDERGVYRYKLAETSSAEGEALATFPMGEGMYGVYERTASEMDADYAEPETQQTDAERIAALEARLAGYEAAYVEGVNEA